MENNSSKLKWIQRFFSVVGNIAPNTSLLILSKLIFIPKRRKLKPPHSALIKESEKKVFTVGELNNARKKRSVKYYQWGTGAKTVLLIHGWDGMALDFYKMIPPLIDAGFTVIAMDGPAHGGSDGETTNTLDFKFVLEQFFKKNGAPYALIGHSMGGAASAFSLMDTAFHVERLVMITAPIIAKNFFEGIFQMFTIPAKMQKLLFKKIKENMGKSIDYLDLLKRTEKEKIQAAKILFVYDENDTDVPYKDIRAFLDKNRYIVEFADDSGHNKVIRSKPVIDKIIAFLK